MKELARTLRRIPRKGWIAGVIWFGLQYLLYAGTNLLSRVIGTADHAIVPKLPFIDDLIPVLPVFSIIYIFSFILWLMAPAFASLTSRRNFANYLIGLTAAYLIGAVIFTLMPTRMDREAEGLLALGEGPGLYRLLGMIYASDGGAMAYNLFPSYHCLISLYCYLGIRRQTEVPKGIRVYSLVSALLICVSTVVTKQHYFLDVLGGTSISLVCYLIVRRLDPAKRWLRLD